MLINHLDFLISMRFSKKRDDGVQDSSESQVYSSESDSFSMYLSAEQVGYLYNGLKSTLKEAKGDKGYFAGVFPFKKGLVHSDYEAQKVLKEAVTNGSLDSLVNMRFTVFSEAKPLVWESYVAAFGESLTEQERKNFANPLPVTYMDVRIGKIRGDTVQVSVTTHTKEGLFVDPAPVKKYLDVYRS